MRLESTKIEFKECDTCAAKAGMIILCAGCLHNRQAISVLRNVTDRIKEDLAIVS